MQLLSRRQSFFQQLPAALRRGHSCDLELSCSILSHTCTNREQACGGVWSTATSDPQPLQPSDASRRRLSFATLTHPPPPLRTPSERTRDARYLPRTRQIDSTGSHFPRASCEGETLSPYAYGTAYPHLEIPPPHTHVRGRDPKAYHLPPSPDHTPPPPLCEMRESEVQGVLRTHSLWCTVYRTVYIRNLRLYTRGALYGLLKPWNLPGTVIPNFVQVDLKKL